MVDCVATIPASQVKGDCSVALCPLHSPLDPLVGIHVGRWVNAFGRKAHDVDHFRLTLFLVEAVDAVDGFLNALMSIADGELHAATRPLVLYAFKCCDHLVGCRLGAALGLLRPLPRNPEAEQRK